MSSILKTSAPSAIPDKVMMQKRKRKNAPGGNRRRRFGVKAKEILRQS
jgi:hypothetical protein